MNVRTIAFNAEDSVKDSGYERGFWERDGAVRPAVVAYFLTAQMIQTMAGGGFYRTSEGLFGALVHDQDKSVLALWSENFIGTTQMRHYVDPFDIIDLTPRPMEELASIPDYYRDVHVG